MNVPADRGTYSTAPQCKLVGGIMPDKRIGVFFLPPGTTCRTVEDILRRWQLGQAKRLAATYCLCYCREHVI